MILLTLLSNWIYKLLNCFLETSLFSVLESSGSVFHQFWPVGLLIVLLTVKSWMLLYYNSIIWSIPYMIYCIGTSLLTVLESSDLRVVVAISADLAHTHDPNGPYGYSNASQPYDDVSCVILIVMQHACTHIGGCERLFVWMCMHFNFTIYCELFLKLFLTLFPCRQLESGQSHSIPKLY